MLRSLPFDFKGIVLGSDIAAVENTPRFQCRDPQSPIADRICSLKFGEKETIAGAPVQVLLLYYYAGKLEMITVVFDETHFSGVATALVEKYGEGSVKTEALQPNGRELREQDLFVAPGKRHN